MVSTTIGYSLKGNVLLCGRFMGLEHRLLPREDDPLSHLMLKNLAFFTCSFKLLDW